MWHVLNTPKQQVGILNQGESYAFTGANHLEMDESGFVVLNKEMDATM
jgi:hypothetical protein